MTMQPQRRLVADGLPDLKRGQVERKLDDLKRRLIQRTLPFDPVMKALQGIIEGRFTPIATLHYESSVQVSAVESFNVADHFKKCVSVGGKTIEYVEWLFDPTSLVEKNIPAADMHIWRPTRVAPHHEVLDALGGQKTACVSFAHIFQLMNAGQDMAPLGDKYNIPCAFVREPNGEVVRLSWYASGDHWQVLMNRLNPDNMIEAHQIFSY